MSSRWRRTSAREEGFTLLEQVVVMALLMIVMTAFLTFFSTLQRTSVRQIARGQANDDVRVVMQRMTKEMRQLSTLRAGSGPSVLDMDTFVDGVAKRITYTASGEVLTRAVDGGAALVVLERLTTTNVFTYAPSLAAPTDITIFLQIRSEKFKADQALISLTSEVKLRNRGG